MSRVLSELMGVSELQFRQRLMSLERAAGLPGADIRLAAELVNETRSKIGELGLDPQATTGPELYEALRLKLLRDEVQVRAALNMRADGSPQAVLEAVQKYLAQLKVPAQTFVVKQSVMRVLLKKLKPTATMKRLGYRSLDSMIKHEPVALLLAAVSLIESHDWQQRRLEAYKKLRPSDFESRKMAFLLPTTKRWPEITAHYSAKARHSILTVPELGTVILLPPEHDVPGLAINTLLLAVDSLNSLRSRSSYLKLQQVQPDFGVSFVGALLHEPLSTAELAGETLPWKLLQWFYGNDRAGYYPGVFEPHVQGEDLTWVQAEEVLADLSLALAFWRRSQLLALLDGTGQTVSLNILDVAVSVANELTYGQRLVHNMREALSREIMARYLHHDNLQTELMGKLDGQLLPEIA